MINKNILLLLVVIAALVSCNGCTDKKETQAIDYNEVQQDLIEKNKKDHEKEVRRIQEFIREKQWPMTETKTGLQYWIYEKGTGAQPVLNDYVFLSYAICLLDGTECYKTTDANPRSFKVGEDNVESGLHEAVQLMHVGDHAKLILPSHLAFGFTGDSGKIPQNSTVVYDVHLVAIEK